MGIALMVGTFQWAGTCRLKSAPSRGDLDTHLMHGSLGSHESAPPLPQTASRPVQPFCTVHPCARNTHTQTLHATSVARGRIDALHADKGGILTSAG